MNAVEPLRTPQVITFKPDGTVEGLQFKNRGLDLRAFGRAKIERTSEIIWNEAKQAWTVQFLHGNQAGRFAGFRHLPMLGVKHADAEQIVAALTTDCVAAFNLMTFADYDDAVKAEVIMIQSARLAGLGDMIAPASAA